MDGGRASLKADDPTGPMTAKGPRRRTSDLEEGRVVEMWRRRSQTCWPGIKCGAGWRRRLADVSMALRASRVPVVEAPGPREAAARRNLLQGLGRLGMAGAGTSADSSRNLQKTG